MIVRRRCQKCRAESASACVACQCQTKERGGVGEGGGGQFEQAAESRVVASSTARLSGSIGNTASGGENCWRFYP
eukprot:6190637-Pleurochrysis_carterae.AAC.2